MRKMEERLASYNFETMSRKKANDNNIGGNRYDGAESVYSSKRSFCSSQKEPTLYDSRISSVSSVYNPFSQANTHSMPNFSSTALFTNPTNSPYSNTSHL